MIHDDATAYLLRFDPTLRETVEFLVGTGIPDTLPKGTVLARGGDVYTDFFYVRRGVVRNYLDRPRNPATVWLTLDDSILAGVLTITSGRPSLETIEVLETAEVLRFDGSRLDEYYAAVPGAERLGRLIVEHYFMLMTARLHNNTIMTARDRYVNLLEHTPELVQRVPLGIIASYLGMTQETLSRVRGQLSRG